MNSPIGTNLRDTSGELRWKFDGSSSFINGGHQILKVRQKTRFVPDWAKNNAEIKALLLKSFPKMETHPLQRQRAGRWVRVIHLFFRTQSSYSEIAGEMGVSDQTVRQLLKHIRLAVKGLRANGTGARVSDTIQTSLGGQTETVSEPTIGRS